MAERNRQRPASGAGWTVATVRLHVARAAAAIWIGLAAFIVSVPGAPAASPEAMALLGRGEAAYRAGDLIEATRRWGEAANICRIEGDAALESEALARRGEALQAQGFLRDAIDDLTLALRLAEAGDDAARVAAVAGALGNAHLQARNTAGSRPLIQRSIETARARRLDGILAASSNNLGNLLASTGERDAALAAYDESVRAAERIGDSALAATALTNKARAITQDSNRAAALPSLEAAVNATARMPASRDKAFVLIAIGRLAATLLSAPGVADGVAQQLAYVTLREAAILAEELGDRRAASLAYGHLGELYAGTGRGGDAAALTGRALFAAQQADAPDLLYRWEWQNGRLQRAAGEVDRAVESYRRAVAALQSIRPDIPVEYRDGRSSFRETIGPLFFELADLLLQRTRGLPEGGALAAILNEARDTVEQLKAAELQDYFKDQCIAELKAKTKGVEAVSDRTAAIYPIILPDRLELLIGLPDAHKQITVPVGRQQLTEAVRRLRSLLEKRTTHEYLLPARQVYDWVVRPLEAELARHSIDTLVFVPDGPLRTIPLAALHDGKDFVVKKYAIATAPGLTLIDPKPIARPRPERRQALVTGLSEAVQGYPALPNVGREVEMVGRLQGGTVLTNEQFRTARFEQYLRQIPYSIVHVASHGEFAGDAAESFVLAFDGKITLDRLERTVKFGEFRDDPLELLTLSACRTAAGDDRAALGLAGVAIKAGARSALASLWFISDEAASDLVIQFYEGLKDPTLSKAGALRQAQLALLGDRRFRHPGYWSAFLVIGNWL